MLQFGLAGALYSTIVRWDFVGKEAGPGRVKATATRCRLLPRNWPVPLVQDASR